MKQPDDMKTRQFKASDLKAAVDIYCKTFAQPPWQETWDDTTVHDRLGQIMNTPHSFGVASVHDGELTGFILGFSEPWHNGFHYYLKEMCIDYRLQRQGIGTALINYLRKELSDQEVEKIYLFTTRGDLSEAFYTKNGFYTSPRMIMMGNYLSSEQI